MTSSSAAIGVSSTDIRQGVRTESGERLLRMHAQEVVELILKKAGKDVLKQIELAAAVKDGLADVNPNKDLPSGWPSWRVSSWLKEIKNKLKGRFPRPTISAASTKACIRLSA